MTSFGWLWYNGICKGKLLEEAPNADHSSLFLLNVLHDVGILARLAEVYMEEDRCALILIERHDRVEF